MWAYLKEATRTHPFNFFTLMIALLAAGFAGWSAWEAHRTRLGADESAADQKKAVERSLALAEQDAAAVKQLASIASAEQRQKLRSWLYAEGAKWDRDHMTIVIDVLNKGGSLAQNLSYTCERRDMEGNHPRSETNGMDVISPNQHKNLYINVNSSDEKGRADCTLHYGDVFEEARRLHFVCVYDQADEKFQLAFVTNP